MLTVLRILHVLSASVLVGWVNFALTLAVPILGAVVLTSLD